MFVTMPEELLETYRRRIHARIIKKVNAYVSVDIEGDGDVILIYIRWNGFKFRKSVRSFDLRVLRGETSDMIADEAVMSFKQALFDEVFIHEKMPAYNRN